MMVCKRENSLIKLDVTRNYYPSGGKFIAFIPPMVGGVAEEDTRGGPVFKFVNGRRRKKRVTQTTKGAKVSIGGMFVVEKKCRGGVVFGFGWEDVENISGHLKGMMPKGGW